MRILTLIGLVLMAPAALVLITSDIMGGIILSLHTSLGMESAMYIGMIVMCLSLWQEVKSLSLRIGLVLIALIAVDGIFATLQAWNP